ncbi:ABC transporter substrate-binding protein [Microbacterium protaetiae]|uniref:ABC transporter substrate-binding protein n=1 Tax=Microbacterium protaetiae TaxID=2509458 RepID=UPI0013EA2AD5|nr:ABC transporter substrate-binding protein [Microbacterium protaetiae]
MTDVKADYLYEAGELPAHPQRVLALWRTGSELADIGVVPVGTLDGEMLDTELTAQQWNAVKDVPSVGSFDGVDLEDVIALKPDLIVGMDNGGLTIDYKELGELFPVRILKIAEPTDVWDNYETLAALVGKSTDFDSGQSALDARLADIASQYGDKIGELKATAFGVMQGAVWVDTSKSLAYRRIDAAGFGYNPTYTDNPERYATELSLENLPSLADQDIIFYDTNLDGSVSADVQAVLDEPAFAQLPAVKAGHVYPLRGSVIYTFAGSNAQVDDLEAAAKDFAAS